MTTKQKATIAHLRSLGYSYQKIATMLDLSENTIKSYCQRNGLGRLKASTSEDITQSASTHCLMCGVTLLQSSKRKFCSDKCRTTYWKSTHESHHSKTTYHLHCIACGKSFTSVGNKQQKYCSHACYIQDRFGGV